MRGFGGGPIQNTLRRITDVREFRNDSGELLARYFFIQDPDGYKIEVLERHGHYQ